MASKVAARDPLAWSLIGGVLTVLAPGLGSGRVQEAVLLLIIDPDGKQADADEVCVSEVDDGVDDVPARASSGGLFSAICVVMMGCT